MGGSPSRVAADASLHAVTPDAAPARPPLRNLADASPLISASAPNLLKMPPRQNPRTSSQRRSLNARSKSFAGAKLEQVVKSVMRGSFAGTAESTTPLLLSQLYSTDKKGRARRRSRTASHGSPSATPRIRIRSRGVLPSLAGVGKHTAAEAKYPMWLIPVPGKKLPSPYPPCVVVDRRFYSYSAQRRGFRACVQGLSVTLKRLSPRRTSSPVSFADS